ncbi:conserved hypothetical protein [Ricinus communis]|uniref:TPX2 C-terminal domain-containing protein n=1 Tax=Ricinus communis TaxID=3988 RepID=B9S2I4_RICCO|nr:conserved hypothetical protein [Ricinus communis]
MGESIVATSYDEDKMGETATSDRSLEVSVSFGRFENDSLSWEKWSSFSPNKYLEEVEKCATPGSVAMKKAYFEAHYKKIAAKKAEQLGQEKQMEHKPLGSNDQNGGDPIGKANGIDSEFDTFNTQTSSEGTRQEIKLDSELDSGLVNEPYEDGAINLEAQGLSVEQAEEELCSRIDGPSLNKPEETPFVREAETIPMESQAMKDLPKKLDKEAESIPIVKERNAKINQRKEPQKVNNFAIEIIDSYKETTSPMSKVRDMARIKKKPASPVAKSTQLSTPKVTKTGPTSGVLSTPQSSTKKATVSSLPKSKSPSVAGNNKVAPKSLHMSLSMDTPNSDPAPLAAAPTTTARKSFIMEKMKDKEIVKRAFKTFQNNYNQLKSSADERSLVAKQVPTKGTEVKVSSSMTPRKENAGSFKAVSMDKKTAKAAPSSFGLKSDERTERRKELSKKLVEKSNANEAESTGLRTKSKEEKGAEIRKLRQSLNFKGRHVPGGLQDTWDIERHASSTKNRTLECSMKADGFSTTTLIYFHFGSCTYGQGQYTLMNCFPVRTAAVIL